MKYVCVYIGLIRKIHIGIPRLLGFFSQLWYNFVPPISICKGTTCAIYSVKKTGTQNNEESYVNKEYVLFINYL